MVQKVILLYFTASLVWAVNLSSQKALSATKIELNSINIDGVLSESAWMDANVASEFEQLSPTPLTPPTYQTDVRVLYDDHSLYVSARLYDAAPQGIARELALRDRTSNTDWFAVGLDTYKDGINAFIFRVSAAGVQYDSRISASGEDVTWDAVWDSSVGFEDDSWVVEMKIPFSAIRFANVERQEWGLQFGREIRNLREESYWNPIKPDIPGRVNQFGVLKGLEKVYPPIRLFLTPFITAYLNDFKPSQGKSTTGFSYSGGMDLKYGINDAFTLDMTLIPDFGQVISDNNVLNLSAFEVFFEENRQFFKEGLELFNKGNLFYTRRVGGRPYRFNSVSSKVKEGGQIIENPTVNRLLNATKVSGRTKKGVGLGVFNAIEARQYATVEYEDGTKEQILTNPLTNYNVLVIDKNLPNNSNISFMNTNVMRQGDDPGSNVTAVFYDLYDESLTYNLSGYHVVNNIIKPDDINTGYSHQFNADKVGGLWRYGLTHTFESYNYNINDLGFLRSPNEVSFKLNGGYYQFQPSNPLLNRWNVAANVGYERLHKPFVFTDFFITANSFILYKSGFAYGGNIRLEPVETHDYFEPRTKDFSRYLVWPKNFSLGGFISTDYRKKLATDVNFSYRYFDYSGRENISFSVGPRIRFNDNFSLFWRSSFNIFNLDIGYVNKALASGQSLELKPDDVLLGLRNRSIAEHQITARFIFNAVMGIDMRIRHYWDNVSYKQFALMDPSGNPSLVIFDGKNEYGEPIYDNNYNLLNIDMQYQWRFAPGSDLIFVWKSNVFNNTKEVNSSYFDGLAQLYNADRQNSFSLRLIYFIDYQSLF